MCSWHLSVAATLRSLLAALSRHPAWEIYKLSSLFMGKQAQVSYFGETRNPAWLEDNHKERHFLLFSTLLLSLVAPWKQWCVSPRVTMCHPSQGKVVCTNIIEENYWVTRVIPCAWMLQIWKQMLHYQVGQRCPQVMDPNDKVDRKRKQRVSQYTVSMDV